MWKLDKIGSEAINTAWLINFRQLDTNLDILQKREPQLKSCFHPIGMILGQFLVANCCSGARCGQRIP